MKKEEFLSQIKGGLIVSCQAQPGEPLYCKESSLMPFMARAAQEGGACGIRAEGLRDIRAIQEAVDLPVIGLIKIHYPGQEAYITPTMREVDLLADLGVKCLAADATLRRRIDGLSAPDYLAAIKKRHPDMLILADVALYEEGLAASLAGADLVSTALSGYTAQSPRLKGPDFKLIRRLSLALPVPVIAEGRIHSPAQAARALKEGAFAAVVGGAITRPLEITRRFTEKMSQ